MPAQRLSRDRRPDARPERIAHRGAPRDFTENTLAAFQRAVELGADAVELDVHTTSDGVVVVHHDPDMRLASHRHRLAIAETPWSMLRDTELAAGGRVPRLVDVFTALPAEIAVYVEIKGVGIEAAVAGVLSEAKGPVAVHSFDHAAVARMRELAPHVPRGLLFDDTVANALDAMRVADARDLWPRWSLIDRALVDAAHAAGGRVIPWTVNSIADARRLAEIGVDSLCTDDVRLLDEISPKR